MMKNTSLLASQASGRGPVRLAILGTVVSFLALLSFVTLVLGFDPFVSDAGMYWSSSERGRALDDIVHLPLYPWALALLRAVTGDLLPPLVYMWSVALACQVLGVWAVTSSVTRVAGGGPGLFAGLSFALWPCVGTYYAVYPVADTMTLGLFAAGLYGLQRGRTFASASALGLAVLANKAIWPAVGLVVLAELLVRRRNTSHPWSALVPLVLPLGLYWLAGMAKDGRSLLWPITYYLKHTDSRSGAPLFDGLLGDLLTGGATGLIRGLLVWSLFVTAAVLLALALREPDPRRRWHGVAITAALLLWFLVLNKDAVWTAVRYSRILALPLGWYLGSRLHDTFGPWSRRLGASALALLLVSQFLFSAHTQRFFESKVRAKPLVSQGGESGADSTTNLG